MEPFLLCDILHRLGKGKGENGVDNGSSKQWKKGVFEALQISRVWQHSDLVPHTKVGRKKKNSSSSVKGPLCRL